MIPVIKGDFLSLKNEAYFLSKFKLTKASLKKKKRYYNGKKSGKTNQRVVENF